MASRDVSVFAAPLPFSTKQVSARIDEGATLQDIVEQVTGLPICMVGAHVTINGYEIPRANWHIVRPRAGALVNVRVVPQGDGGGKKNPLASLLSIAVLVAAPYASAAILGQTLAGTSILGGLTTYGGLLSGAFSVVGKLAISALSPPPKQSNSGGAFASNAAESPTQFIEGARNSLTPYGVVPICLGTNRMFPVQAARTYTETVGNLQYVRQIFTYGYGTQLLISDLKIGETPIAQFNNVEMQHRLAGDLHLGTNLYTNDVYQDDYNVLLRQVDGYTTRTTQVGVNSASLDVTFPRGLCEFDTQGARQGRTVDLEVQYSPAGAGTWTPSTTSYTGFGSQTATLALLPVTGRNAAFPNQSVGFRKDLVVLDKYSGVASVVTGTNIETDAALAQVGTVPENAIRLATLTIRSLRTDGLATVTTTITSISDDRQASLIGTIFVNSGDFAVSNTGLTVNIAAGYIKLDYLRVSASQTEALRQTVTIAFPSSGQYDVRIKRISADTASDQIFDQVYLTALRSITYRQPVNLQGINGTAVRMQGSDQLNGQLDQFNVIVSNCIPDYVADLGVWQTRPTSNPASIFRYVLQGLANAQALPDSKLDITAIEQWHAYCEARGYTYNRIIDYETSLLDVLRDVAAAGAASYSIIDGKRSIVVDRDKPNIVQIVTPRNSWDYKCELTYPELPHAFRVEFRNAEKGYIVDERKVYDDGYSEANATKFERLEYMSCTNSALAFKHGRRHIATARLRPETHTFMMDVENLVATRGDRIKLVHDVPIIGVGDGRVKSVTDNGTNITGFTIDDVAEIQTGKTYYVRIRKSDGSQLYLQVNTAGVGNISAFTFAVPPATAAFAVGDLCAFVEAGGEVDLMITKIDPRDDLSAMITAQDYAPAIFAAESAPIPPFDSKITVPLSLLRPNPPQLVAAQSDEAVGIRNSDGSYISRAVISLRNTNDGVISTRVQYRLSGTTAFMPANILSASPEQVVITGLDDGKNYDIHIYYVREGGFQVSLPLQLNNYKFLGASAIPADVTNFKVTIAGETALFSWDANTEIDIDHYALRFSRAFSGASWETAQNLADTVYETRFSVPFIGGTYFIKAVDILGNVSANANVITTYDPGQFRNVVATVTESPAFLGTKTGVSKLGSSLVMDFPASTAYYNFAAPIDLTEKYESYVSAKTIANGTYINDIFAMTDIFAVGDMFGAGDNDIFTMADIFAEGDIFGIGADTWSIDLEFRTTDDNPSGSPTWTSWQTFSAGVYAFRGIDFRVKFTSLTTNISPQLTSLEVVIDMPDRIESNKGLTVPVGGVTISFSPKFAAEPSIGITLQNGATDDRIEFTSRSSSGFTFRVFNAASAGYVARQFDYIASGYGRVI